MTTGAPPPPRANGAELILHDNKVWKRVQVQGLINAYVQLETEPALPTFEWTGPKIPLALWRQVLSFFKWTNETHHCESQVRLFLNPTTGEWKAWAFPQEKSGMTSTELACPNANRQREEIGAGFYEFGSAHHHCGASAFQSGTDKTDEMNRPGIHLTVGGMADARHSIHHRATLVHNGHKVMYTGLELTEWFEIPNWLEGIPQQVRDLLQPDAITKMAERALTAPCNDPFPEQWKANMLDREPPKYERSWDGIGYSSKGNTHHTGGYFNGLAGNGERLYRPSVIQKDMFVDRIAELCLQYDVSASDLANYIPFINEYREIVCKAPGVSWDDAKPVLEEAILNGDLDKAIAKAELEIIQRPAKLTEPKGGAEWDAQGCGVD